MVPDVTISSIRTVAMVIASYSCKAFAIAKKACNPNATLRLITQMLHPGI